MGSHDKEKRLRVERLEQLLNQLRRLAEFSAEQAKQACSESTAGYVTSTIKQLVNDGVIRQTYREDQPEYEWSDQSFDIRGWVRRQVHADQVTETPLKERPRERLASEGPQALSNAELIAILIRVGVRGESAIAGGRKVANQFAEDLPALRHHGQMELKQISPAVTKASYAQIMAGIELGRRVALAEIAKPPSVTMITSTHEAVDYCKQAFARLAFDGVQEEFHIVTLDTKHKPIRTHRITVGTLDASLVHPREVFRPAIRDAASAILLVHNHPSGDPTPSREDHQVTDRLTESGKLLGITVLDHIVVAKDASVSIREC